MRAPGSGGGLPMPPCRIVCLAMLAAVAAFYMVLNANSLSITIPEDSHFAASAVDARTRPQVKKSKLESATESLREKDRVIQALRRELNHKALSKLKTEWDAEDKQSELDMASWESGARAAAAGDAASVQRDLAAYDVPVVPGPFDATALGRRQECQTLIGAEIVPKIHTLVRMPRRHATVWLATQALAVEGDFLEAGVFTGGTASLMFSVITCNNATHKKLWLADSFAGLPDPKDTVGDETGPSDSKSGKGNDWAALSRQWTASQKTLMTNMGKWATWWAEQEGTKLGRYGRWQHDNIRILAGWFKDTLPTAPIEAISFLRCDADMYSSTKECLHYSYAKISKGGYIYIDDYWAFPACQRAVDEFREENGIRDALYSIVDEANFYFVPGLSLDQVKAHGRKYPRGHQQRFIEAVFWRKE